MTSPRPHRAEADCLARVGFYIVPLSHGSKRPPWPSGHRHAGLASRSGQDFDRWYGPGTMFDLGVALSLSGHIAVDVDVKNGAPGARNLLEVERMLGRRLSEITAWALTPSNGAHYLFRLPPDLPYEAIRGALRPGVELQKNLLAVAPTERKGRPYRWVRHPADGIAELPEALVRLARRREPAEPSIPPSGLQLQPGQVTPHGLGRLQELHRWVSRAVPSQRHPWIYTAARTSGELGRAGHVTYEAALRVLLDAATRCGEVEAYGEAEVRRWVRDGYRDGSGT